jgi:hypothetical protein
MENVRSLCKAASLTKVARDLKKYELVLVGGQESRWDRGDTNCTAAGFVNDSRLLCQWGRMKNHILFEEAAVYILNVATALRILYIHLIHTTCLTHQ